MQEKYLIAVASRNTHLLTWKNFEAPNHCLVLITSPTGAKQLRESGQAGSFKHIVETSSFNEKELTAIVQRMSATIGFKPQDALIATNDEMVIDPCCMVRERLEMKGDKLADQANWRDKVAMKQALGKAGLTHYLPKYLHYDPKKFTQDPNQYITDIKAHLGLYPIFAKPRNDASSRGARVINSDEELTDWCKSIGESTNYELDEFIHSDKLYHCDSIVRNGEILFFNVSENSYPCADFAHGKTTASIPLLESNAIYQQFKAVNSEVLSALGVRNGCTHVEFFRMPNGQIIFVEGAQRSPGASIPEAYKEQFGINVREAQFFLKFGLPYTPKAEHKKHAAWIWFPNKAGTVISMENQQELQKKLKSKITHMEYTLKPGTTIQKDAAQLLDCACSIILTHEKYETLLEDFNSVSKGYEVYQTAPALEQAKGKEARSAWPRAIAYGTAAATLGVIGLRLGLSVMGAVSSESPEAGPSNTPSLK